jgi:hypothetical protein
VRHGFAMVSRIGKTTYGGTYTDREGRTIVVNPKSGLGDVVVEPGTSSGGKCLTSLTDLKSFERLPEAKSPPHVPQSCECGLLLPSRFWRRSAHCIGRSHIELGSSLSINF